MYFLYIVGEANSYPPSFFGWAWELNWHETDRSTGEEHTNLWNTSFTWYRSLHKEMKTQRNRENLLAFILGWKQKRDNCAYYGEVTKLCGEVKGR